MKSIALILIGMALIIGAVPQLTDCLSQGRSLTLESGATVPMKCHWTALAELALALPLLVVGASMWFNKQKESKRTLSILGIVLGVLVILVPTTLIGVCANSAMLCNSVMKPTLIVSGTIASAASLGGFLLNIKQEQAQAAS